MNLSRFFSTPSYLKVAVTQLDEAQLDFLAASKSREYYAAMEHMLAARIGRLQSFISAATSSQDEPLP
jgi:hypothetical protein